jgi:AcrR family transcriptional regulator
VQTFPNDAPSVGHPTDTRGRILEAALRTLGRQGSDGLSMAGIGREAGVSRRTLYRYFNNREGVLEAIAEHVGGTYSRIIEDAVAAVPDLDRRVEVVLTTTVHYGDHHPAAVAVFRMEPGFTLQFLQSTLAHYIDVIATAIEPAVAELAVVRAGGVTINQIAELIIRLGVSGFMLDSAEREHLGTVLARLLRD